MIFISYSSKDSIIAQKICSQIESQGFKCWIGCRDILPGENYGKSIVEALNECTVAVFLLSDNSLTSEQVVQELYICNDMQKRGLKLLPVAISRISLQGTFQYVFQGKQVYDWSEQLDINSNTPLIRAIGEYSRTSYEEPIGLCQIDEKIKEALRYYYQTLNSKSKMFPFAETIYPEVKDYKDWLGHLNEVLFDKSVKLARESNNWNCLYIGKSGSGKTTAFHEFARKTLETNSGIALYVSVEKLAREDDNAPLACYIIRHYLQPYGISIQKDDLISWLYLRKTQAKNPRLTILLDGLSDTEFSSHSVQQAIDSLLSCPDVQVIFSSANLSFPYSIGEIASQRFDLQLLTRDQIDSFLMAAVPDYERNTVPYSALSSPLLLTIFAKTCLPNLMKKESKDEKLRSRVMFESDVFWNYFEVIKKRYCERISLTTNNSSNQFAIQFGLPLLAFELCISGYRAFSLKDFLNAIQSAMCFLENQAFDEVFDEYISLNNQSSISTDEAKHLLTYLEDTFGILEKQSRGKWAFSNVDMQYYLAASHLYHCIIISNASDHQCIELEEKSIPRIVLRYMGELFVSDENQFSNSSLASANRHPIELLDALAFFRFGFDGNEKYAVRNIIVCLSYLTDGDMRDLDLRNLDLRRTTFSHLKFGDPNNHKRASRFDNCAVDEWTFHTYGYSNDRSPVAISSKGNYIISAKGSKGIEMYEQTSNGWELCDNYLNDKTIQGILLNELNELIISTLSDGLFYVDLNSKTCTQILKYSEVGMISDLINIDNDSILISTRDGYILACQIETHEFNRVISLGTTSLTISERGIVFAPNRNRGIAELSEDCRRIILTYDLPEIVDSYISKAHYIEDLDYLICGTQDGFLVKWRHGETIAEEVIGLDDAISDFVVLDDSTMLLLTKNNGIIAVDSDFHILKRFSLPDGARWVGIAQNNGVIAVSSLEGHLAVFEGGSNDCVIVRNGIERRLISDLHIENCSFKHLHCKDYERDEIISILSDNEAIYA